MEPRVALLKGINVGGHRRVPMAELREALGSAGFTEVRTYIQSGNVIFREAPGTDPAGAIAGVVAARFGFDVEVVCRTRGEMIAIDERNPLRAVEDDLAKLHVVFLSSPPAPERVAHLDPDRSPPDRFVVAGREIYLHYPDGAGRSKLTGDYLERILQRTATVRNANTVAKLTAMMSAA